MSQKPEYIFVIEDKIGGVTSFNKNLIEHAALKEGSVVKLILTDQTDAGHLRFPDAILADEVIRFEYKSYENRHSVLKRFHQLLGTSPGAIICNDGLEMEAIYQYGTNKTVYQMIHDFYNVRLAVKYGAITDVFISHSKLFRDVLLSSDPATIQSFWIGQGVAIPVLPQRTERASALNIIFVGRLVESKGVQELFAINRILKEKGIPVRWTIVGRGPLKEFLAGQWKEEDNIVFASPDTGQEVIELMSRHDIFILPTRFEGSPVTIHEALSTGLVPVVSDLPGGIREIVIEDIGRRLKIGDVDQFAETIAFFHGNRGVLEAMSANCRRLAEEYFDILKTSNGYFSLFGRFAEFKRDHSSLLPMSVGFRMDHKWLPNSFVSFVRKITRSVK